MCGEYGFYYVWIGLVSTLKMLMTLFFMNVSCHGDRFLVRFCAFISLNLSKARWCAGRVAHGFEV